MSTTIQKDGRRWTVDGDGIKTLKREYVIVLDSNNLSADGESQEFPGVPAIGSAHPAHSELTVRSYDVDEGESAEKKLLKITVNYSAESTEDESGGESGQEWNGAVEQWGWDAGEESKEVAYNLLEGHEGPLLNSAGDPFDSLPQASFPVPVFTKVLKTTSRIGNALNMNCKLNRNTVTIGSISCAPKTLLATVSEARIFGDPNYRYKYTIQLKYKSNFSLYGAGDTPIEFGWDIPVVDSGMRELDDNNKLKLIMQTDSETGKPCAVTSPELLDGTGHKVVRSAGGEGADPEQV